MRIHPWLSSVVAPALLLWGTAALVLPTRTQGFQVYGDTLDMTQRDFRIWNNFTDPQANDNPLPDPDFPGALGAELAIWKGVAEWGSGPHGSGSTDPTQDTIGSGGSDFDAFYSAKSQGPGNKNANVISMIPGSSFIKASTELPIRDGWRIRFWEDPWIWNDGPGPELDGDPPADAFDLQGVAAHEYGHALGLDHSFDPDATMFASSPDNGISFRSIEADDMAGVQFLYGVLSPNKPRIEGYELVPGGVILRGGRFHPVDNQVWFTHRAPLTGPDGKPVVVKGVPSSAGGTRIRLPIPAKAGPGDVAVRRPGFDHENLSAAFPFHPTREPLAPPVAYGSGTITAAGVEARLDWRLLPSTTAGSFEVVVQGGNPSSCGVLFSGPARTDQPWLGGSLYVAGPWLREAVFCFGPDGEATVTLNVPADELGSSRYFQAWFTDPGPLGAGLSNGLKVTWLP